MKSLGYAINGIIYTVKTQLNMRIHLVFAFYVILAGFVTKLDKNEWTAVLICIGAVTGAEAFNTAVESLCDTLHPGKAEGIAHTKDSAAGAVLLMAVASAVVGSVIFFNGEKIRQALNFAKENPVAAGLILLSLVPMLIFVFKPPFKKKEE